LKKSPLYSNMALSYIHPNTNMHFGISKMSTMSSLHPDGHEILPQSIRSKSRIFKLNYLNISKGNKRVSSSFLRLLLQVKASTIFMLSLEDFRRKIEDISISSTDLQCSTETLRMSQIRSDNRALLYLAV